MNKNSKCNNCKWFSEWVENHGDGGPGEAMCMCDNPAATDADIDDSIIAGACGKHEMREAK